MIIYFFLTYRPSPRIIITQGLIISIFIPLHIIQGGTQMNYQKCILSINKSLINNVTCKEIFLYLCKPETVVNMITFSSVGLPALSGIASYLEKNYASTPDFPLNDHRKRQVVGKLVRYVLSFYGYTPVGGGLEERAQLRKFSDAQLFKTASIYAQTNDTPEKVLTITSN